MSGVHVRKRLGAWGLGLGARHHERLDGSTDLVYAELGPPALSERLAHASRPMPGAEASLRAEGRQ